MTEIHGFCDERFRPLEDAFRRNLDSGLDKGASLAVTLGGEFVVDLWGGTPRLRDGHAVGVRHGRAGVLLVEGDVDDHGPDARRPRAARSRRTDRHLLARSSQSTARATITTRQVLVHRSGLPDTADRSRSPTSATGTARRRSSRTPRPLVRTGHDQLLSRPDLRRHDRWGDRTDERRSLRRVLRAEIAGPLGADFHFGLPADEAPRGERDLAGGRRVPPSQMAERVARRVHPATVGSTPHSFRR